MCETTNSPACSNPTQFSCYPTDFTAESAKSTRIQTQGQAKIAQGPGTACQDDSKASFVCAAKPVFDYEYFGLGEPDPDRLDKWKSTVSGAGICLIERAMEHSRQFYDVVESNVQPRHEPILEGARECGFTNDKPDQSTPLNLAGANNRYE